MLKNGFSLIAAALAPGLLLGACGREDYDREQVYGAAASLGRARYAGRGPAMIARPESFDVGVPGVRDWISFG